MARTYGKSVDAKEQLKKYWELDFDWTLLPDHVSKVSYNTSKWIIRQITCGEKMQLSRLKRWLYFLHFQRCKAVAKLLNVPALAALTSVQGLLSFAMAHTEVKVPNTLWTEPGVLWLAISIPTGKILFTDLLWNCSRKLQFYPHFVSRSELNMKEKLF